MSEGKELIAKNYEKSMDKFIADCEEHIAKAKDYISKLDEKRTGFSMDVPVYMILESSYMNGYYYERGVTLNTPVQYYDRSKINKEDAKAQAKIDKAHNRYNKALDKDNGTGKYKSEIEKASRKEDKLLKKYGNKYERHLDMEDDRIRLIRKNWH